MRPRCPFCQKRAQRVTVQFEHKPQVELCGNCEKVVAIDEYDVWYASAWMHRKSREELCGNCEKVLTVDEYDAWYASAWKHRKSREQYVREVETDLIMTSFVQLMLPRRNSI